MKNEEFSPFEFEQRIQGEFRRQCAITLRNKGEKRRVFAFDFEQRILGYFRRPFAFAFQSRIGLRKHFVFRLLIDGDLRSETRRNHSEKRSRQRIATAISRKIEEFFPLGMKKDEKVAK